jgi:CheY-like chemotaxis protein
MQCREASPIAIDGIMIQPKLQSPVVLIAEDDPADLLLLQAVIRHMDGPAIFRFVRDGQEALDYVEGCGVFSDREAYPYPAVFIMDSRLSKLNGIEVLRLLKSQSAHAALRGIIWTDSQSPALFDAAYEAGASGVVHRPIKIEDLRIFLEQVSCLAAAKMA